MGVAVIDTPVGGIEIATRDDAVVTVRWTNRPTDDDGDPLAREAARQLAAYFDRALERFDLPLAPAGTPFQRAVYDRMLAIPFGETRTYGQIATETDSIARAVGGACGSNPIPLIIPCHRVVAGGGALGGFSGRGGRRTKAILLAHESPQGSLL